MPERMQRVQALIFSTRPFRTDRTRWRLGLNRRLFTLWAWLTLLPTKDFFPQISHFLDIFIFSRSSDSKTHTKNAHWMAQKTKPKYPASINQNFINEDSLLVKNFLKNWENCLPCRLSAYRRRRDGPVFSRRDGNGGCGLGFLCRGIFQLIAAPLNVFVRLMVQERKLGWIIVDDI